MLVDLDVRFRVMDAFEGYQQILSIATPSIEAYASPADAADLARRANDGCFASGCRAGGQSTGMSTSVKLPGVAAFTAATTSATCGSRAGHC